MADFKYVRLGAPYMLAATTNVTLSNFTLNESTDAAEWVFQAPEAITISRVGFRVSTRTGTVPTYRFSIQGVDTAAGTPDGTVKGGGSPASATSAPAATGWTWLDLANPYACTRGELLAFVIDYSSGTINSSNCMAVTTHVTTANTTNGMLFPYVIQNNAGSRSRLRNFSNFAFGSTSTVYGSPVSGATSYSVPANDATACAALRFMLPHGAGEYFRLLGARCCINLASGGSYYLRLYDGGGSGDATILQEVAFSGDVSGSAGGNGIQEVYFDEANLPPLQFGRPYRLGITESSNAGANIFIMQVASQADLDAYSMGREAYISELASGTWTDTKTSRPLIEPILADVSAPRTFRTRPLRRAVVR